jgi:hypothetical protein
MAAPPLRNSFDGGADGVGITIANSGGGSGNAFDNGVGTLCKYTAAQQHSRALGMGIVDATVAQTVNWTGLGSITSDAYFRFYMYLTALPTTGRLYPLRLNDNAAAACGWLRLIAGTGTVSLADASQSGFGADGTVPVAINQWVRIELHVVASTTAGVLEWRLYNTADSTSIDDSAGGTGLVLGANLDQLWFGSQSTFPTTPFTVIYDDLAVSTAGWIGPAPVASTLDFTSFPPESVQRAGDPDFTRFPPIGAPA